MQSRRDLIKEKNNKIAELTEQMEKNKREFGEEELKHIKVSNEQEAEISRLRAKVAAVETELRSIRSNKSQQSKKEEQSRKPSDRTKREELSKTKKEEELRARIAEEFRATEDGLKFELELRDDKIKKYEEYIERYVKGDPSSQEKVAFYQSQIDELEKELINRD